MNRKALIIGAPAPDIPGVKTDLKNYRDFLLSPLGGAWVSSEVVTLISPSEADVSAQIQSLSNASYSLVVFAGHGRHPTQDGSTLVELRPGLEIDSVRLRRGAEKHTLILDCCRKLSKTLLTEDVLAKAAKRELVLTASECRTYYDKRIADCGKGLVVLFACGIDETAGESPQAGGYYSASLMAAAHEWKSTSDIDLAKSYKIMSITDVHEQAATRVKALSGSRQNPTSEYPRTELRFPFAVLA
ncbi:caspase family protein [Polaromonas jejuensis]|uniref:Caspase family protein n=1 Tax=Polaromonas jejuensis TaxID=457502 RepID=A0ABW0QCP6_9BURK|nr:caspase family protein [Polaromonas jejuensis]